MMDGEREGRKEGERWEVGDNGIKLHEKAGRKWVKEEGRWTRAEGRG